MTKTLKIEFDSIDALCAAAIEPSAWETAPRESVTGDRDFTGTDSIDQALDFARHGWAEGLARMTVALDSVAAAATATGPAPSYSLDVAGAFPLVPAAVGGDPLCMFNPAPINERARPVLRIATSTALRSDFQPHEVFNYGAGLIAIIDALEQAGFSTELTSCRCNESQGPVSRLIILTKLKGAGEALDRERLAFCLGSASFNRRIHFGVVEARCPQKGWGFGYGSASIPQHGSDIDSDVCLLPGPTMFRPGSDELSTPEKAFSAMKPKALDLLRDRYASFPALFAL